MTPCLIDNPAKWNKAVLTLPAQHVLQSWDWGEVKSRHGWTPARLLWEQAGHPVAAAQVLRRPVPHTPLSVMYVPKGPALDYTKPSLLHAVLADLETYARRKRAIFCKIDPDVEMPWPGSDRQAPGPEVSDVLAERRWRPGQEIQFRNTALLDLTPSCDALLSAMKSKTRYNIRLAERRGIVVRPGTLQDMRCFYDMYEETGRRDDFLTRPFEYYRDTWQTFMEAGRAHMLLAQTKESDQVVAGIMLFRFGAKAWYMYGASTSHHRNRMPNYALQWEAICWARSMGCTTYDLWGAPETLDESDRLWGVWRFKEGLGARFTAHVGAHDYPTTRLLYWAYETAVPKYLDRLRKRRGEGPST